MIVNVLIINRFPTCLRWIISRVTRSSSSGIPPTIDTGVFVQPGVSNTHKNVGLYKPQVSLMRSRPKTQVSEIAVSWSSLRQINTSTIQSRLPHFIEDFTLVGRVESGGRIWDKHGIFKPWIFMIFFYNSPYGMHVLLFGLQWPESNLPTQILVGILVNQTKASQCGA